MSAAWSTGYVMRPTLKFSLLADFSRNCGMRRASPYGVMHSSTHARRGCSGTWLWTKSVQTSGSSPQAMRSAARSSVDSRSCFRLLRHRDRVQVDDRVERIDLVLLGHPAADGADEVAEVLLARRLDSGEDAHLELDYRELD